jgi:hypothetical protein
MTNPPYTHTYTHTHTQVVVSLLTALSCPGAARGPAASEVIAAVG